MSSTEQYLTNFNDENDINILQALIVRSNDFAKDTVFNVNLYFTNLKIVFSDQNYLMIKNESDIDLVLFLLKTHKDNIQEFPNFNSSKSSEFNGVKDSNKVISFTNSISFNLYPFSDKKNSILITPSVMKNLGLIASMNISIYFDSICANIQNPTITPSGNSLNFEKTNSESEGESKIQNLKKLFVSIIEKNGSNGESYNFYSDKNGSENLNISIKSIENINNLFELYQNYGDYLVYLKKMS